MIIENEASVTEAVMEALSRTEDPRLKEILLVLVRHLHGFVREVRLTEREFQQAVRIMAEMGQKTTASHNEVVLMAGSLGVSALVCLLNNGDNGQTETQANAWPVLARRPAAECKRRIPRHSPRRAPALSFACRWRTDRASRRGRRGRCLAFFAGGPLENQDPAQAEMNLRGRFRSDASGRFRSRASSRPATPSPSTARSEIGSRQKRHN